MVNNVHNIYFNRILAVVIQSYLTQDEKLDLGYAHWTTGIGALFPHQTLQPIECIILHVRGEGVTYWIELTSIAAQCQWNSRAL